MQFAALLFVLILCLAAGYGLVNWAKRAAEGDKAANMGLYLLFGIPGGLLTVAGSALLVNAKSGGWLALGLGLGLALPLVRPFRVAWSRISGLDPESPIDFSGLSVSLAIVAILAYSFFYASGTEADATPSASETVQGLVFTLVAFVAFAYIAVGYRNYRTGEQATERLGLSAPTAKQLLIGVGAIIPAFVCSYIGGILTQVFQPDVVERLSETMDNMTSGVQNPAGALVLGLCSGIGEELLFRGALVPRFGIVPVAVFWAMFHLQYELTWVLLGLVLMGIMFGWIRQRYGTVPVIITHALFNVLVVFIQMAS